MQYLLQNGANIHQETVAANLHISYNGNQRPQYRVLAWAIRYNQPQAIRFLLARGVGTLLSSHVPEFKPMHLAAVLGHEDLFDMLLAVPGCAIDDTDSRGHTPLHYASLGASALDCWGSPSETGDARLSSIRGLLQRRASTTSTNVTGATALELSFRYHKDWDSQASLLLLAAEPPAFIASDRVISSAIICAQLPRNRDVFFRRLFAGRPVSRLYASGTDDLAMNSGWDLIPSAGADFRVSLLIWSIVERDLMGSTLYTDTGPEWADILPELLLNIGATPHLADSRGRTPLHACVFSSMASLRDDDDKWNEDTALIFSWNTPHRDRPFLYNVVAELIKRNASLDVQDDDGSTPLDYALDMMDRMELDDEHGEPAWAASWYAWRVTKFTLKVAYECGMCPSDAQKIKLTMRLGLDVFHPDDPLAVQERKRLRG